MTRPHRHRLATLTLTLAAALGLTVAGALAAGCSDIDDCEGGVCANPSSSSSSGSGGSGGTGGSGGSAGGTGGADPCGGCGGATPYCDAVNEVCEACLEHAHCTEAGAAQCDGGDCVPCTDNGHCASVTGASVCEAGSCVQCAIDDTTACTATQTCSLIDFQCVDIAPGSVLNCQPCSNDEQCDSGHRCIAMDFPLGTAHGHYCLLDSSTCSRPFSVTITQPSINGAATTDYCGLNEDMATCEAVNALQADWRCPSDTDGMCSPDGIAP